MNNLRAGVRSLRRAWLPLVVFTTITSVLVLNTLAWRTDRSRARSRRVQRAFPSLNATPAVSVLVAAWNEFDNLASFVHAFSALHYPEIELVMCAGGADGTFELAQALVATRSNCTVLEQQSGEGKQHALQRCFEQARGEILVLTDADCELDDASLVGTLAPIINDGEAVATGASAPMSRQRSDPFVIQQWFSDVYSRASWGEYTSGILGRNAAITRAALLDIGAFETPVPTGTDYHMAKELLAHGYQIRVADSQVSTQFADTFRSYRRQQARWLRNVVIQGRAYGETEEVAANLVPSLLGAVMLLLPLAGLLVGPMAWVVWMGLFAHTVASRARYCRFGEIVTGQHFSGYLLIPAYALLDFLVWAAVLPEYARPRARRRW
ncbi:MAG: glycosyltransferase [Anaerolineae bacterium]